MAKLPFKTEPKKEIREVGNEDIGILEFPVLNDFTVREQAFINDQLAANSTFLEIARIANKVAKAAKIQGLLCQSDLKELSSLYQQAVKDKKIIDHHNSLKRLVEQLNA